MDIIKQQAKKYPHSIAIQYKDKEILYKDLDQTIQIIAHYIHKNISEKRIGINITDPLESIYCIWGTLRAGKTIYLLNHRYNTYTTDIINHYNLKSILTACPKTDPSIHASSINKTQESSIRIFTSGTTAIPKCIIHSINTLMASAKEVNKAVNYQHNDIWHCQLPFYHVSGLAILWRTLLAGATIQLLTTQPNYTHISCVEKQLESLIKVPTHHHLKCILIGGSAIKKSLLTKAIEKKLPIYQSYGLTETGSACTLSKLTKDTLPFSGQPLPHINIQIINNLIHVKGSSRCLGFETSPKNITNLNKNEFYNTLDYGKLSKENQLSIKGRSNRMIIINGENIFLETIETVVKRLNNVNQFYLLPITENETIFLYGFIDLKQQQPKYKSIINQTIKTYFSSLCIPKDIQIHNFTKNGNPRYSDIKAL